MIVYPAIDIRQGRCVRLLKGRFDQETVYGEDPAAMARRWQEQGAAYLHVVDLDGARAGRPQNTAAVQAILAAVHIPVQLGGGLRSAADVQAALDMGVSRVVLGSVAVAQPTLVRELCGRYGEKIAVAIDARDGQVAVDGWEANSGRDAVSLAVSLAAVGVRCFIYTDISRDGTLAGANVAATRRLAAVGVPVIASGGVRDLADVRRLARAGLAGVIIGRALYTGAVDLAQAIKTAQEAG